MLIASIFLGLALLASTLKSIVGKKVSVATNTVNDISFFHGVRMFICVVIGAALVLIFDGPKGFIIDWRTLLVAAITGFGFAFQNNILVRIMTEIIFMKTKNRPLYAQI